MPRCLVIACTVGAFAASAFAAPGSTAQTPSPAPVRVEALMVPTDPAVVPPPTADDIELAKAHYKTGEIYYDHGRFPDAAHEFEEAYRLSRRAALLYNMGKSYDGVGDAARALTAYRRFLDQVPTSPDRPTVEKRVAILTTTVGRVQVRCTLDDLIVRLDGQEVGTTPFNSALEINPGGHTIDVAHEGYATWHTDATVTSNQTINIDAEPKSLTKVEVIRVEVPQEKPKPVYKRWWLWTAVGLVVAAGVVTAVVLTTESTGISGPSLQLPGVRAP